MGSKALHADVQRVFREQVEVQRCQIHKWRNVREYLPENCQKDYDRRMSNAYAMNNYAEARRALCRMRRRPTLVSAFWEQAELFPRSHRGTKPVMP
jgi:transposase-like protein